MVLKAYYDGSGKSDTAATTLTGVAAPEELWQQFAPVWLDALDRHSVLDRDFHMADLMNCRGNFQDWDESRCNALLTDLFNAFGQFRSHDIAAYSCTVFFDAYKQAYNEIPNLRKPAAMCVDYCVGGLQLTVQSLAEKRPIILYFDRNEEFMHTVNRIWLQAKRQKRGWPRQIRDIVTATRADYPIQAADMLAWIINRNRIQALKRGKVQPHQRLNFADSLDKYESMFVQSWFMVSHHMKWYDDPKGIMARYPNG